MATTVLSDRVLRRALTIGGRAHTLTLDDNGLELTEKGRRMGLQIRWEDLVNGDTALAVALNASLTAPLGRDGTKRRAGSKAGTATKHRASPTTHAHNARRTGRRANRRQRSS
ncbi:MAG: hypothetical protein ACREUE_04615 [Panacagrimonas sp.]